MVFDISKVSGISDYSHEKVTLGEGVDAEKVVVYRVKVDDKVDEMDSKNYVYEGERAFLVIRKNTLEVRTDEALRDLLIEKYESVMQSRYFGRGGIEIVDSGQLDMEEINDLVRLSYNLSKEKEKI